MEGETIGPECKVRDEDLEGPVGGGDPHAQTHALVAVVWVAAVA